MKTIFAILVMVYSFNIFSAEDSLMGKEVGELAEKWQFPSDHVPVGISLKKNKKQINIMTWNILNNCFMLHWVYKVNSQGLKGSLITELDRAISKDFQLTERDMYIVNLIVESINNPFQEKDFICLQECSKEFLMEMKTKLPKNYSIIFSREPLAKDQEAIIYRSDKFSILSNFSKCISPDFEHRVIMDVIFQSKGINIRLINAHLPFLHNVKPRSQLIRYLYDVRNSADFVIIAGDMNCTELDLKNEVKNNFSDNTCLIISPYPTVVYPKLDGNLLRTVVLDHFLILGDSYDQEVIPIDKLVSSSLEALNLLR